MRKLILILAFVSASILASASAQAGAARNLTLAAHDEPAAVEADALGVSAVGDHPGSAIVHELAAAETNVPNRLVFGLDVESRARSAHDSRASGVVELAVHEDIAPSADQATTLPPIVLADDLREPRLAAAAHWAIERQAVQQVMMTVDPRKNLGAAVVAKTDAAARDLPAGVAILTADHHRRAVAVQLDVADFDRPAAILDVDHREVRRSEVRRRRVR